MFGYQAGQGQTIVKGNAELRHLVEAEERKRMENDNKALITEELDSMKIGACFPLHSSFLAIKNIFLSFYLL